VRISEAEVIVSHVFSGEGEGVVVRTHVTNHSRSQGASIEMNLRIRKTIERYRTN
jgi:hypothetical protein